MMKYSDKYKIRNYHTGPNGLAYIPSLFHFMYDAAGDHCIDYGITVQDLQEIGLTWMLSRINVEIKRLPATREELTVTTWPTGARDLYSCRDFQIIDENGGEICRATSAWLTIDLKKRRVVRLPKKVLDIHPEPDSAERMIIDNFKGKLSEPDNSEIVGGFRADYSSLDVNSHVTSGEYIKWLLDALPLDFHVEKKLRKIEIIHKMEILPGCEAQAEYNIEGNRVQHCIRPYGGGAPNCLAESVWE
ncbi:MAG: thioesterase [Spirochaetales bacterium]|uniref:Thioesterase n=1 Tax=Candidatus Thalassospirochaeta sargassi TaxID=3119039 RepID=A0AAJ1MMZ1_9SPIO|nr:thioesterase [Spirochaetales bacterium]